MQARVNPFIAAPDIIQPLLDLGAKVNDTNLEFSLCELVKIRASQINRCVNCLHMHTADARTAGASEARIYLLNAWRESRLYTPRERAALAWTEALTQLAETGAPDDVYNELRAHFTAKEMVELTLLITTINTFNRFAVGFRVVHPEDAKHAATAA
ncbi:alkylhydroperoxidase [Afipia sp. P52-10]|jgi:AhpD family alkylhydroperoxidase|uniref:carboxymuconolactone decarboxylase family protein n=1 Tax=Afipia sp. P52-10 TaxID=1429916 RepID=UPI0003DF1224|nr:carboxymuconolactone decarboxylase family protein [Afipia sp. P52-10]ETR77287.1 alkylhydroperoxidase [Afipia sp. P52-10]